MLTNSPEASETGRISINSKYHVLNEHIGLILSDSGIGPVCHVEKSSERRRHIAARAKLRFGLHGEHGIRVEAVNVATTCAAQLAEAEQLHLTERQKLERLRQTPLTTAKSSTQHKTNPRNSDWLFVAACRQIISRSLNSRLPARQRLELFQQLRLTSLVTFDHAAELSSAAINPKLQRP